MPTRCRRIWTRAWSGCTRSRTASTTGGARDSVAEVDELERDVRHRLPHQLDRGLQLVLLRAGDAHRVALDRGRDLELRILDELLDLLALVLRDADLDRDRALHLVARDLLYRAGFERAHVDVALGQALAQDVEYLAELELVVGEHGEHHLGLLHARIGALEVEAVRDFLVGLLDRVLHFLAVDLRDDVEGGHRGYRAFRRFNSSIQRVVVARIHSRSAGSS